MCFSGGAVERSGRARRRARATAQPRTPRAGPVRERRRARASKLAREQAVAREPDADEQRGLGDDRGRVRTENARARTAATGSARRPRRCPSAPAAARRISRRARARRGARRASAKRREDHRARKWVEPLAQTQPADQPVESDGSPKSECARAQYAKTPVASRNRDARQRARDAPASGASRNWGVCCRLTCLFPIIPRVQETSRALLWNFCGGSLDALRSPGAFVGARANGGELDKTERISLQLIVAGLLIGPIVGFLYLFSVLGSGPRTYEWGHRANAVRRPAVLPADRRVRRHPLPAVPVRRLPLLDDASSSSRCASSCSPSRRSRSWSRPSSSWRTTRTCRCARARARTPRAPAAARAASIRARA